MTRPVSVDDLYSFAIPEQPAISPDGSLVAYVLRRADRPADRDERSIWVVDAAGGQPQRMTTGPGDSSPSWSPDGTCFAFLREEDGIAQVWVLPSRGGEPQPLTALRLGAGSPVWSPDGRHIAFTAPADANAHAASTVQSGLPEPVVIDRLDYQSDGAGLLGSKRRHVYIVDVGTGETTQTTSGDGNFGNPAWSPDGTQIAVSATLDADADLTGQRAAYVFDVSGGDSSLRRVGPAEGSIGPVTWTTDGRSLVAVGRTDTASGQSGLLRISLEDAEVADLAEPLDRNVMAGAVAYPGGLPQLAGGGNTVLFCAREAGCTHLYGVDLAGGPPQLVLGGAGRVVSGLSVSTNGAVALVLATAKSYGEIVTVTLDGGEETICTAHGSAALSDVELIEHVQRMFTISDGTRVEGWLLRAADADGPQPLLLDIHGGPHNAWNSAADPAHLYHQVLASRGWSVLLLNPRGSDGYGQRFAAAVDGAWGLADTHDFLEPLDQLVEEGIADPRRLAVTGYSYGGYMTCYLTAHDSRFSAAVPGGPVADLISISGTADIGHHVALTELGSRWWADPDRFREMSPITHVAQVRTPTLVLQGAADLRCPVGQGQQWFAALREQNVPTRLVLYPEASHTFILRGRPSHRVDYNRRVIEWVERFAGSDAGPRPAPIDAAHWQARLDKLGKRFEVPGAALGILRMRPGTDDENIEASYGVLNTRTGVAVTSDTLFQIGSITKVWTATVVMQLVDEGLLDLDAPILDVLPELRLGDPEATRLVTMRHLLTHTSGVDGDIMTDTGRGDDCIEKFVATLDTATQIFPVGASWSYCNTGFAIAGRVIEKLTGLTWDEALRERLFKPLGVSHTVTLPEEALLFRTAVGHLADDDSGQIPAPFWMLPRSVGPAGLISSTTADVLAFARMHLAGGLGADGTRVLGEASVAAMQTKQVDLPDAGAGRDSWGLGWSRVRWSGHRLIGHDGGTVGQSAFFRMLPEQGLAVVLLTNTNNGDGGQAGELYEQLFLEIFTELADVQMEPSPQPPDPPVIVDMSRHIGRYEREGMRIEVVEVEGLLMLRTIGTGPIADQLPHQLVEHVMTAVDDDRFLIQPSAARAYVPVTFYSLASGDRFIHLGVRASPFIA